MANSLAVTQETTFGSDGTATIVVGPTIRGEQWEIEYVAVSTDNVDTTPTEAYLYREPISNSGLIEATTNGNADITNTSIRLTAPELLWVQWRNGAVGTRAMLRLEGKREY